MSETEELKSAITQVKRDLVSLTDLFTDVQRRLARITKSLRFCQSRCHVDNPGRWSKLWEAVVGLFARPDRRACLELDESATKDPAKGSVR